MSGRRRLTAAALRGVPPVYGATHAVEIVVRGDVKSGKTVVMSLLAKMLRAAAPEAEVVVDASEEVLDAPTARARARVIGPRLHVHLRTERTPRRRTR